MPGIALKMEVPASKIHEDALFFDKLVELVPAKFYFENEEEQPNWKYMHNRNRSLEAKQAAREGVKKAKRAKLDPSNYKSNLEIQKERAQLDAAAREPTEPLPPSDGVDDGSTAPVAFQNGVLLGSKGAEGAGGTHSELKQRLQDRIQSFEAKREMEEERKARRAGEKQEKKRKRDDEKKSGREIPEGFKSGAVKNGGSESETGKKVEIGSKSENGVKPEIGVKGKVKKSKGVKGPAKEQGKEGVSGKETTQAANDVVKGEAGKRKANGEVKEGVKGDAQPEADAGKEEERPAKKGKPSKEVAVPMLQFNKMEVDSSTDGRKNKSKGKSKREQKKDLLKKATKLQTELKETAGTREGQEKLAKHTWTASLKRASGEKVLDDPKLLKKSIKSEEKKREHSAKKWKGRQAEDRKAVAARQEKRNTNLKERSDAKKERKIQKREKKLLSPGRKKAA